MQLKMAGATTRGDAKRLCDSCTWGNIIKGEALDDEIVYCSDISQQMTFKVLECGGYQAKNKLKISDLAKIAWIIDPNKKNGEIGFVPPKDRKAQGVKVGVITTPDGERHHVGEGIDD